MKGRNTNQKRSDDIETLAYSVAESGNDNGQNQKRERQQDRHEVELKHTHKLMKALSWKGDQPMSVFLR